MGVGVGGVLWCFRQASFPWSGIQRVPRRLCEEEGLFIVLGSAVDFKTNTK